VLGNPFFFLYFCFSVRISPLASNLPHSC